jgi:hypothetical protein
MGLAASTLTITLQDADGQQTKRSYEGRIAAFSDANAIAAADLLQAITQLEVVDVQVSRRVAGFTPIAAEGNSSVAETASVRTQLDEGDFYTFNLPALKAAVKSGATVNGSNADLKAFLNLFDNGDGVAADQGTLFVSDGETISEAYIEANNASGKVNR